jgi:hypothetical protein
MHPVAQAVNRQPLTGPGFAPGLFTCDLWWTKWHWDRFFSEFFGFSPVRIIPPWLSMLISHLGDGQWARWWPQFWDTVWLHRHEQDKHIIPWKRFKCDVIDLVKTQTQCHVLKKSWVGTVLICESCNFCAIDFKAQVHELLARRSGIMTVSNICWKQNCEEHWFRRNNNFCRK